MSLAIIAALVGLAFLDASTLSTLLVPLWLLSRPGPFQPGRMITYMVVTFVAYLALGVAVLTLAHHLIDTYLQAIRGAAGDYIAIGLGAVVIVMGGIGLFRTRREAQPGPSLVTRLRDRALKSNTSVATLALSAIAVEAATMWPYLIGISLVAANGPGLPLDILWLALYTAIMILPAAILSWARTRYPDQTDLLLSKTRETMTSAGSNVTAWLAIVVGTGIILVQVF